MQTGAGSLQTTARETNHEGLIRRVHTLRTRINTLRELIDEKNAQERQVFLEKNLPLLRQGLSALEQMADELFYELQFAGGEPLLAELPDLPLAEALSQRVEATAETLSISTRTIFSGQERPISDNLSRLLYRIAQEALAQVPQHAGARRLRFSLDYQAKEIVMSIEDDGVPGSNIPPSTEQEAENPPFPPFLATDQNEQREEPPAEQIIRRLHTIVERLGGTLTSNGAIEQGTQIQVRMPYNPPEVAEALQQPAVIQAQKTIKLLIVDAQTVSRAGLRRLLESYPDLEVVGEAGDSIHAVSETAELLPDVILIDGQLPGEQSLEILQQIKALNVEIHTLLLSAQENEELLYKALRTGASGYLLKDIAPDELVQSIRAAARGEILIQPQLAARLLTRSGNQEHDRGHGPIQESLTAREREVLQLLTRGLRNKEIAARLFVSERTVNFHLANIYAKLHVSGRTEALSKALEQGLLKA